MCEQRVGGKTLSTQSEFYICQVALACSASLNPICVQSETLRTLFGSARQTRGRRSCSVLDEILAGSSLLINANGMPKHLIKQMKL